MAKIVVVGSFNTDLVGYTRRLPGPGETVDGSHFATGPGGKGTNQAVAAARLGAEVTFVGRIGRDVFAGVAEELWEREGIDARFVVRDDELPTGVAQILVDEQAENSIVVILGANLALDTDDVDAAAAAIAEADVVLTQLEVGEGAVARALEIGRETGATTILNPAPARELPDAVLASCHWITPNETELATLQQRGQTLPLADQALAVTLGRAGCRYVSANGSFDLPSYEVKAVDSTGAGDAFNGGLAVALAEGREARAALTFASAVAALSVTREGASESMPTRDEVDALLGSERRA